MTEIVRLENVTKDYGAGSAAVQVLRGINLTIGAGDFSVLAGPSGSGKSTLLNLISGLDRPGTGHVYVDGTDTANLTPAELSRLRCFRIGLIFQSYNLLP